MIQQNRPIFSTLFLILATLGWHCSNSIKPARAIPIISEATSKIELFAVGASRPQLVGKNRELRPGELLKVPSGVRVRIACDNGDIRRIPAGITSSVNNICLLPPEIHPNRPIIRPRLPNKDIPYIISPRATFLLTNKPILRWNRATGANNFRVSVRGQDLTWMDEFNGEEVCQENICEVAYYGNTTLQIGASYKLVIETTDTNRSSEEDTTQGLGFQLIEAEKAEEIKAIKQRLEGQDTDQETKVLFLANRYAEYNLIAEAIDMLEALSKEEKNVSVYRLLGDLYLQIGLILKAEVEYLDAVELAKQSDNLAELAAAKAGLGEVMYSRSQVEAGISLLEEAKQIYEDLEDEQRVRELNEKLEELKR